VIFYGGQKLESCLRAGRARGWSGVGLWDRHEAVEEWYRLALRWR